MFVKGAVEAAVKIALTDGALSLPADKKIDGYLFFAALTNFHDFKIQPLRDACQAPFMILSVLWNGPV